MKKIVKYIAIIFFTYLVIMVYLGNTNQYFSYSEMDYNSDGFLSFEELLRYNDVITFVRYDNNTNNFVLQIFQIKDSLILKEIPLDNNDVRVHEFIKMQSISKWKLWGKVM